MKILVCGDKHLKITRFETSKLFLEWLNKTIELVKPDLVVALGDDMDTHAVLRSELLSEFRKHIDFVMNLKIPMIYLVGNHDYFKPGDSTYHAFQSMIGIHPNFIVVDKHMEYKGMDFVPYISDHTQFPDVKNDICFAHQTFIGADYGYHRPDVGVDADKLKSFIIVSGHIHKRQTFGKVIYPGSPYASNLNDVDQDKGVMIFDTETYNTTYISSPFPKWRSIRFDVDTVNSIDKLHETLQKSLNKEDNWILVLSGLRTELSAYLTSKDYLKLIKGVNVTTKLTLIDNLKKNIAIKSFSIQGIVGEYINRIYSGSLPKEVVQSKALEIISKNS